MFIMVSYDIEDNKLRSRVRKILEGFGKRVQFSVFECFLSDSEQRKMKREIQDSIKDFSASVRFYILCEACNKKIEFYGTNKISNDDQFYMV